LNLYFQKWTFALSALLLTGCSYGSAFGQTITGPLPPFSCQSDPHTPNPESLAELIGNSSYIGLYEVTKFATEAEQETLQDDTDQTNPFQGIAAKLSSEYHIYQLELIDSLQGNPPRQLNRKGQFSPSEARLDTFFFLGKRHDLLIKNDVSFPCLSPLNLGHY